jgi:hypothetical protein
LTGFPFYRIVTLVNVLEPLISRHQPESPQRQRHGLHRATPAKNTVSSDIRLAVAVVDVLERLQAIPCPVCFLDSPAPVVVENRVFFLVSL